MLYRFQLNDLRLKWLRNKRQLSSTCLDSSERRSEWMRSQVQYALGQHFIAIFFLVKPLMPILLLLPILCVCEKLDWTHLFSNLKYLTPISTMCSHKFLDYHKNSHYDDTLLLVSSLNHNSIPCKGNSKQRTEDKCV